jgi:hypothetical protein
MYRNITVGTVQSVYGIVFGTVLITGASAGYFFVMVWQRRMRFNAYCDPYDFALLTVPIVCQLGYYVIPFGGMLGLSFVTVGILCGQSICVYTTDRIFQYGLDMVREGFHSAKKTVLFICQNVFYWSRVASITC